MDIFFMSVWDDARQGTKYYICYGEDTSRGYHTDTLPILWLPDSVAVESEASRIVGELWHESNTYYLAFEPDDGKHFFAPIRRVFELLGELKRFTAESLRNSPLPSTSSRTLGQVRRTGEDSWVMYGAGGGGGGAVVAGVDVGNGQMAFDIETAGLGIGGAGGPALSGSEIHQHLERSFSGGGGGGNFDIEEASPLRMSENEWRSLSARQRAGMTMTEREYNSHDRTVSVTFADGRRDSYTEQQYNRMVDEGSIIGFGTIG